MSLIKRKLKTAVALAVKDPHQLAIALGQYGFLSFLPDKMHLKLVYRAEMGKKLDLCNPKEFSEKLQWLKLYDRQERYTQLVDKYAVREIIKNKFGEEVLIPIFGVFERPEKIEWSKLPNKFVIKCTHGSGCNIVCHDKSTLNYAEATNQLKSWLKKNWFYFGREWPYKNVRPRIIVEKFVTDNPTCNELTDYKFYCFEGEPKFCQVIGGRHYDGKHTSYYIDFYDNEWNKMPFSGMRPYPHSPTERKKPVSFDRMKEMASELSINTHFVRIDFYEINGKPFFGEFTLYPLSGFGKFEPEEWNKTLGALIKLPTDQN